MNFTTKDFDLDIDGINNKLGLHKNINVDYQLSYGCITWTVDIEAREWGIKSITPGIIDYQIEIKWQIIKDDLTSNQIQRLLQNDLGEHYPAEESEDYIEGKIILNKNYKGICEIEFTGDLLKINEVIINFNDYEITII